MEARLVAKAPHSPLIQNPTRAIQAEYLNFAGRCQRELAQYPPQQPQTRYRRTGTLGRGWATARPTVTVDGVEVVNLTDYASLVQGSDEDNERVRWAESYGWPGVDEVLAHQWPETEAKLTSIFERLQQT